MSEDLKIMVIPHRVQIWLLMGGSVACGILLYAYPQIDLWISSFFFKEGKFYLRYHPLLEVIHNSVPVITGGLLFGYVARFIWLFVYRHKKPHFLRNMCHVAYLVVVLCVGPGLTVNTLFKDQWGRARPGQIEEFGGDRQFTPAFVLSDQCHRNCSFVSGDPSIGFYFITFVFLYGRKWWWLPIGLGLTLGLARIMQGAHFFSDVLFSGIITMWVAYGFYILLTRLLKHKNIN